MTPTATVELTVGNESKGWIAHAWTIGVYSASRLTLNLTPTVLTLVVLRVGTTDIARTVLVALAVTTFLTNVLATWLELVLYRFPVQPVRSGVRLFVLLESAFASAVLLLAPARWAGSAVDPGLTLRVLLFLIVVPDLVYRVGAAALQMAGEDRIWIRLNAARVVVDLSLVTAAACLSRQSELTLCTLAGVRILFALEILRISPLYRTHETSVKSPSERWIRYGFSISLWITILQVLQYLPQFMAFRFQTPVESTAFLAAFRLFFQTSLLVTGILLLYVHPKLFQCFQEYGSERFLVKWSVWLPRYTAVICGFSIFCALAYPLLSHFLLTDLYAGYSTAVLYTVPGIISLSVANYVQKLLEVREDVLSMALYLAIATASFVTVAFIARSIHSGAQLSSALCAGLSFSFTLYLGLVSVHAARMRPALPPAVLRSTRLIAGTAFAALVLLAGLLILA